MRVSHQKGKMRDIELLWCFTIKYNKCKHSIACECMFTFDDMLIVNGIASSRVRGCIRDMYTQSGRRRRRKEEIFESHILIQYIMEHNIATL